MVYWPKTAGLQMTFANSIKQHQLEVRMRDPSDIVIISHSQFYNQQLIMVSSYHLNIYQSYQYDLHMASKRILIFKLVI